MFKATIFTALHHDGIVGIIQKSFRNYATPFLPISLSLESASASYARHGFLDKLLACKICHKTLDLNDVPGDK